MRKTNLLILAVCAILCSITTAYAAPEFDRFQAQIGVDDGCKGRTGEGIFRISVDGKEVFKSDVMLPGQAPKPVDVSIAGAKDLKLFIDDEGDGHGGDWGDWLDARLVNSKTGEFAFLTDLVPEERAWIASNKDRNIIYNKLSVDGKTYARGWGCISGDEMTFRNWNQAITQREVACDKANAEAAKRVGSIKLNLIGDLPSGLSISMGGKPVGGSIEPESVLTVTTDPGNKAHAEWWKAGKCSVTIGSTNIPLSDLVQPTDRVVLKDTHPNRPVLIGDAPLDSQAYCNGKAMPGTGAVTFTIKDIPITAERILASRVKIFSTLGGLMMIKAKQFKTAEVPNLDSITSSVLTVLADDKPIGYVLSDNQDTWSQTVMIKDWPKKLECIATPGADGSLGDGFVVDIGIKQADMKEPLWLRDIQPSYNKFDYREAKKMLMAGGWELPGSGIARWDNLSQEMIARKAGLDALPAAEKKIEASSDPKEIYEIVDGVLALDLKQPDIRIAAADRFKELGDLEHEREQWGLIDEASRADLALMQKARTRIDEIWASEDPEPFVYPDTAICRTDGSVAAVSCKNRAPKQNWTGKGSVTNKIWSITLDKDKGWKSDITFKAPKDKRIGVIVNSLGVEVSATLRTAAKTIASKTAKFPVLDVDLAKAGVKPGEQLVLTVSLEPDVTGIILSHHMEFAVWPITYKADVPTEQWNIDIKSDGSANVCRTSKAPVIAAIPRTAVKLTVNGANYTIQEPIAEYLVEMDGRLYANLPILAVPQPGKTVSVSYTWPDAAYNVSPSVQGWSGRKDHCYLATPSALLNTEQKSIWRATWPKDWKDLKSTPEPSKDDPKTFFVESKGGLNAEWEAKDVMTPWIVMSYKNLNFYAPDNPNNRRWFPLWMKYVRRIYDVENKVSGHTHPFMVYIAPTSPGQLSGYGGASVSDPHVSETWIAATGRMCPQTWRYGDNVTGVDAHELHWIFLNCRVPGSPTWTDSGFGSWLEQIGWECACLSNTYRWRRTRMESLKPTLEMIKAMGHNPIQSENAAWDALPNDLRVKMIHLGWFISDEIYKAYGPDFWAKFWAEEAKLYPDVYRILSDRAKQILFVDELVRVSGDPKLRDRFTNEWLFDLTPDPQDSPDRLLILPRSAKVTMQDKPVFAAADYDDRSWLSAIGVGTWDEQVPTMEGYRGVAWYRYTFDVPFDFKTENLEMLLGHVTNTDEVYLNGERIGSSGQFPPNYMDAGGIDRVYKIKQGLLKPGQKNVLAIRIYAANGSGGIDQRVRLMSRIGK